MPEEWSGEMPPGGAWRAAVSAVVGIGWLIFLIIYLFFYAKYYSIYENIAIFLVSVLVVAAILAPLWIVWGMRNYSKKAAEESRPRRRKKSSE